MQLSGNRTSVVLHTSFTSLSFLLCRCTLRCKTKSVRTLLPLNVEQNPLWTSSAGSKADKLCIKVVKFWP